MTSGFLFGNPVPHAAEIPRPELSGIIKQALHLAEQACASGSDNTPFVLRAIKELSGGRSVLSNRVLVESNVRRGAAVATELCKLRASSMTTQPSATQVLTDARRIVPPSIAHNPKEDAPSAGRVDIFVAGSLAMDLSCDYKPIKGPLGVQPQLHTSNPATISQSVGGVAHNVAKAAHLAGGVVRLCSAVGDDLSGATIFHALRSEGMDTTAISRIPNGRTAQYVSVNDAKKDLMVAMADMTIFEALPTDRKALRGLLKDAQPKWFVTDANWEAATLHRWLDAAKAEKCRIAFEPVSITKAQRLFDTTTQRTTGVYPHASVDLATPNRLELAALHTSARQAGLFDRDDWWRIIDALGVPSSGVTSELTRATSRQLVETGVPQQCIALLPLIPCIICKLGPSGVVLAQVLHEDDERLRDPMSRPFIVSRSRTGESGVGGLYLRLFPAVEEVEDSDVVSVTGAGDTFLGLLLARLTQVPGVRVEEVINVAQSASVMSLKSNEAVSPQVRSLSLQ